MGCRVRLTVAVVTCSSRLSIGVLRGSVLRESASMSASMSVFSRCLPSLLGGSGCALTKAATTGAGIDGGSAWLAACRALEH
jgi:hypothetical protein